MVRLCRIFTFCHRTPTLAPFTMLVPSSPCHPCSLCPSPRPLSHCVLVPARTERYKMDEMRRIMSDIKDRLVGSQPSERGDSLPLSAGNSYAGSGLGLGGAWPSPFQNSSAAAIITAIHPAGGPHSPPQRVKM